MQNTANRTFWQEVAALDFLSDAFSWFFMLLTRLAEPFMLLATLYVIAEAGVPSIAVPWLHNLAIGIMICAPEIILPGSFVVAARAQEHARLLFAICWTFVGLTLLTLISLFVWHFTGASLAWLMCARCAAAVGYSILMRVMAHGQIETQKGSRPDMLATLTEHLQGIEANIHRAVSAQITETEQRITEHFTEQAHHLETLTERRMTEIEQRVARQVQTVTEHVDRAFTEHTNKDDTTALPALFEQFSQDAHKQITALAQEVKHSLKTLPARPKLSLVAASPSTKPSTTKQEFEKGAFVRSCLTERPDIRNAEIIRLAVEQGQNISSGYVSEIRKAFTEEQSA